MKDNLRKEIMKIRNNVSKTEVLEKSNQIKKRLFESDEFKEANTILFYVSYDNEVYTPDMIKESISNGKHVVVPATDKENKRLILSVLEHWDDLDYGAYGIIRTGKRNNKRSLYR